MTEEMSDVIEIVDPTPEKRYGSEVVASGSVGSQTWFDEMVEERMCDLEEKHNILEQRFERLKEAVSKSKKTKGI